MTRHGASDTISLPARQTRARKGAERENLLRDRINVERPLERMRSPSLDVSGKTAANMLAIELLGTECKSRISLRSTPARSKSRIVSREIATCNSHALRSNVYLLFYIFCCMKRTILLKLSVNVARCRFENGLLNHQNIGCFPITYTGNTV